MIIYRIAFTLNASSHLSGNKWCKDNEQMAANAYRPVSDMPTDSWFCVPSTHVLLVEAADDTVFGASSETAVVDSPSVACERISALVHRLSTRIKIFRKTLTRTERRFYEGHTNWCCIIRSIFHLEIVIQSTLRYFSIVKLCEHFGWSWKYKVNIYHRTTKDKYWSNRRSRTLVIQDLRDFLGTWQDRSEEW